MSKALFAFCLVVLYTSSVQEVYAQRRFKKTDNTQATSLLWEVSGNGLAQPSYIFGTFHLMKSYYIDSFKVIKKKFEQCKVMIGEMDLSDTTGYAEFMASTKLQGTTLEQLYSPQDYTAMDEALRQRVKISLKSFNQSTPMYIEAMAMQQIFAKAFPHIAKRKGQAMDMYFQNWAREMGMKVVGLESIGTQARLVFATISLERQATMLKEMLLDSAIEKQLTMLLQMYYTHNLSSLAQLINKEMKPEEIQLLLNDCNSAWMPQLEGIIKENPAFIAVGAGHLPGEQGLIALLKAKGYTLKPVALK